MEISDNLNDFDFNKEINDYSLTGIASEGLLIFFSENGFVPELLTALSNVLELPENTIDLIRSCLRINPNILPKNEVDSFLELGMLSNLSQENKELIIDYLVEITSEIPIPGLQIPEIIDAL